MDSVWCEIKLAVTHHEKYAPSVGSILEVVSATAYSLT